MRSKLLAFAFVGLLAVSLIAAPAAAVDSASDDVPEEVEAGAETEATFELTNLYDEFESWTLRGETNMTNVTWTVQKYDQAGNQVEQNTYDGGEFTEQIDIDESTQEVHARVTGTAPEIEAFSYEPVETFRYANFDLVRDGGTEGNIDEYQVHHYTADSKEARERIDQANGAVDRADDDEARSTLESAISAYDAGNFENAISLAERAEDEATGTERTQTLLTYAAIGVAALLVIVGLGYLYKKRQQGPSRLR